MYFLSSTAVNLLLYENLRTSFHYSQQKFATSSCTFFSVVKNDHHRYIESTPAFKMIHTASIMFLSKRLLPFLSSHKEGERCWFPMVGAKLQDENIELLAQKGFFPTSR
ncbi:hypothetical protein C5167_006169 [Papaver somniferum]|uniref:Uncharacterized protein n=1 Tax=Papaver somniferum TaxID=3469 RepID=A0A4Y7JFR7_PAPSO|nr:hypothetical protein C5167_006169 [Papaver somniferum]